MNRGPCSLCILVLKTMVSEEDNIEVTISIVAVGRMFFHLLGLTMLQQNLAIASLKLSYACAAIADAVFIQQIGDLYG